MDFGFFIGIITSWCLFLSFQLKINLYEGKSHPVIVIAYVELKSLLPAMHIFSEPIDIIHKRQIS